ncbi:hypothetical protein HG421_20105 [Xanthomonas campestris pv. badrii]|uniref:Uncharacterized protein n=1 Tax=Xanthomonas campestris pv. badrii TaxID=149696 RepID=A0A7Z2VDX5_XANCA|nr:hypothetical protein [Xanthomonas campestris]QJD69759.1 hypothetical protein HG421_20105 [Xanthomonas campestris pv. badrii]
MPSSIPYRSDAVLSATTLNPVLAWTCVVLVAFVVILLLLKKKGLIARWQGGVPLPIATGVIIKRAEYRLSRSTVVYLLEVEGENVVIAESKGQLSVQRLGQTTGVSE